MDPALYDIARIAAVTGLEESLVRFYEQAFAEFLPAKVPVGDHSAYPEEAVTVFRTLASLVREQGLSVPEAKRHLRRELARTRIEFKYARVVVVASGKGGVGKTTTSLNLAIEMERRGRKTIVFDADFGLANIHILAGVTPRRSLSHVAEGLASMGEVLAEGPENIGIVAGGSGVLTLADLRPDQRERLIEGLHDLERCADCIIVDAAPGISANVLDFIRVADDVVVIVTPDLLSITDAYGLLKAMSQRGVKPRIHLLVNQARSMSEAADVHVRLETCAKRFLDLKVESLGYIFRDPTIAAASENRIPVTVGYPTCKASRCYTRVAAQLDGGTKHDIKTASTFGRLLVAFRDPERAETVSVEPET